MLLTLALSILKKDFIRNCCIIKMIESSQYYDIDILHDSVFIRLKDQDNYILLSANNEEDGIRLLSKNVTKQDRFFFTIDWWPCMTVDRRVLYHSDCVQLYLPDSVEIAADEEGVIVLTDDMSSYIHKRYDHKDHVSEAYIKERIRAGCAFGIIDSGVLAGWVMTHEEGTMGVLTVLPEFRRKGYAQKLNSMLVKRLREEGSPCLVHILKENKPSLALANKSGMIYSCDVHWVGLE